MIEAKQLTKHYSNRLVVDQLNLTVKAGQIYCLLGSNGAGKTTSINMFLGFTKASSGKALIAGIDCQANAVEARRRLAYISESVTLYDALSGRENLNFFCAVATGRRLSPAQEEELLSSAGLHAIAHDEAVSAYSKGMRQKVGIAIALARDVGVLLLDEPTSGLDPTSSLEFVALIKRLSQRNVATLMVTHDLLLAKQLNSEVGIMHQGRLVEQMHADSVDLETLQRIYVGSSRLEALA